MPCRKARFRLAGEDLLRPRGRNPTSNRSNLGPFMLGLGIRTVCNELFME